MSSSSYRTLEPIPLIGNLVIDQFVLANGLRVAVVVDATTPIFTYQTWFKVGSADEPSGRQGLAHLFEHMMFRKTSKRAMGEFERIVNNSGGTGINAYTARDQTVYYFTFPSDKLPLAADLESDRMINLEIDDEMFRTEKGAVVTEKNRGLDDPNRLLWETVYKFAYTEHNYRFSTIGEIDTIESFTAEEAREFYRRYYSPNNSLIVVVGDVDPARVLDAIAGKYGTMPVSDVQRRAHTSEPLQQEERRTNISHPKATRRMMAKVWHIPNMTHPDYPALAAVGRLLTSGKSAVLNERLLNTAKASELYADAFISRDCGTFELYVQLGDGETFEGIEKIFFETLTELAGGSVSDDQLRIVKNILQREHYRAITAPAQLARMIGDGFIYADDLSAFVRSVFQFESVHREDIVRVVRKYILDARSTTVTLIPEPGA